MSSSTAIGVFFVSLSTLALELLLTRIWSVLTDYHLAFVAVSLAMFGLAVGAILVYLFPNFFQESKTQEHLSWIALAFAVSIILSFMTQMCVPFVPRKTILGLYLASLVFGAAALPFCFSGVCLALVFTRFANRIGQLYAADLVGAAAGCILVVAILTVGDAPSAVFAAAAGASAGAYFFAHGDRLELIKKLSATLCLSLLAFAYVNSVLAHAQKPLISFIWSRGSLEEQPLYQTWNAFSRVTVQGDPTKESEPHGWGLSSTYTDSNKTTISQLWLQLDAVGQTPLTKFSGNCEDVRHLKFDVCNFAYNLMQSPKVLVIGAGGGRDVLSALCAGARSILAVDINPAIISTVNERFGDFTGHLDRNPRIRFVAEDARTYISRVKDCFDVIQISVIDTGVLSGTGALALTESSLYTVEAWQEYLSHLTPDGVISCTRWYRLTFPGEVERLIATAREALNRLGASDPRQNIIVVRSRPLPGKDAESTAACVMVRRKPFTQAEIELVNRTAEKLKFIVSYSPVHAEAKLLEEVASGSYDGGHARGIRVNLQPVTDDSPFFFYMLKPLDAVFRSDDEPTTSSSYNAAEYILLQLLAVVFVLSGICLLLPMLKKTCRSEIRQAIPYLIYFAAIGLGYIFVEISQMQRLIIFLGHPTYSLSAVLFTLLLSSGIGSYSTSRISDERLDAALFKRLTFLLVFMIVYGTATPSVLEQFKSAESLLRIAVAVAWLFPVGYFMGMAFPLGLRIAVRKHSGVTALLWGVNGAASILASVLAVVIAIASGLTATYISGFACYGVALISLLYCRRSCQLGQ